MQQLSLTLPTTAENLALDEWLLTRSDSSSEPKEVFRIWENPKNAVIIGRSSKVTDEVNQDYCQHNKIDFLRRSSGGASVVIGPGCLMYAAVLDYRLRPQLRMLDQAHQFVMALMQQAIQQCGVNVAFQGTCDLTLDGRKFSGNSLRCQRNSLLYHGTLLYDFDLEVVQACLGTPPRQPEYRKKRSHRDFVTNLPIGKEQLSDALLESWKIASLEPIAVEPLVVDTDAIKALCHQKYLTHEWTFKR